MSSYGPGLCLFTSVLTSQWIVCLHLPLIRNGFSTWDAIKNNFCSWIFLKWTIFWKYFSYLPICQFNGCWLVTIQTARGGKQQQQPLQQQQHKGLAERGEGRRQPRQGEHGGQEDEHHQRHRHPQGPAGPGHQEEAAECKVSLEDIFVLTICIVPGWHRGYLCEHVVWCGPCHNWVTPLKWSGIR